MAFASCAAKMRSTSPSRRSGLLKVAVQSNGERQITVRDTLRFQLNECIPQATRFHLGRAVHHRRRGAFGFLYVGHHRVPLREVVALRAADLAARRVQTPRSPFERDGHHAVEPVQVIEEIRRGAGRRGQERVENHGLAVESKVPAFGFKYTRGEPPIHPTAGRPIPRGTAGLVHEFGQEPGAFVCIEDVERGEVGDERPAGWARSAGAVRVGRSRTKNPNNDGAASPGGM